MRRVLREYLGLASVAFVVALLGLVALAVVARAPVASAQHVPRPGSDYCVTCHSNPHLTGRLQNGETVALYVNPSTFQQSVHAAAGLTCRDCHTSLSQYPHRGAWQVACTDCHRRGSDAVSPTVDLPHASARALTLAYNESCRTCHDDKSRESGDGVHARLLAGGNPDAPTCVDCHSSHQVTPPAEPRARIAQTCARCHQSVYTSYRVSVHGAALAAAASNPDVPTCIDCHGVHNVRGPSNITFRNDSVAVCGSCHADQARMEKYGVSTAVFQTYLDDFHGRTVSFFRQRDPRLASNKATCFDCHGIHNIRRPDDPLSTAYPANLQATCRQCHPDAGITFPQAWLGHYAPTLKRTPVLFAVNRFYELLIPTMMVGLIGYIGLDAGRRLIHRRRAPAHPAAQVTSDEP